MIELFIISALIVTNISTGILLWIAVKDINALEHLKADQARQITVLQRDLEKSRRNDTPQHPVTGKYTKKKGGK